MATDRKVRLVIRNPAWKGTWFFQRENDRGLQEYVDDPTKAALFTPELAVYARDKFRQMGNKVFVEDIQGNTLFERESSAPSVEPPATHESRFVPLAGGGLDGLGYIVRHNPQRGWYVRAIDVPSMQSEYRDRETLWGSSPEEVVNKMLEQWTIKIAVPFEDPQAAARAESERQQAANQKQFVPRIRPGDLR